MHINEALAKNRPVFHIWSDKTLVMNTKVAESLLFVWLDKATRDLTSWPSG